MGADIAMNIPEGAGWPEGVPFKDWLHAERVARGWSVKEFAIQMRDAAGETERDRYQRRVESIDTLIRRWEAGRTAISDKWLPVVMTVFANTPVAEL